MPFKWKPIPLLVSTKEPITNYLLTDIIIMNNDKMINKCRPKRLKARNEKFFSNLVMSESFFCSLFFVFCDPQIYFCMLLSVNPFFDLLTIGHQLSKPN